MDRNVQDASQGLVWKLEGEQDFLTRREPR